MRTTRFDPKERLDIFAMDLRERISKTHFTATVTIISTGNIEINKAKLNESAFHTAPYDDRYGNKNWYLDEEQVPGKRKGEFEIIPVTRNVFDPELKIKIKRSIHMNYDDWCELNRIINETADHRGVTFNLKSTSHVIRQGADWGCW